MLRCVSWFSVVYTTAPICRLCCILLAATWQHGGAIPLFMRHDSFADGASCNRWGACLITAAAGTPHAHFCVGQHPALSALLPGAVLCGFIEVGATVLRTIMLATCVAAVVCRSEAPQDTTCQQWSRPKKPTPHSKAVSIRLQLVYWRHTTRKLEADQCHSESSWGDLPRGPPSQLLAAPDQQWRFSRCCSGYAAEGASTSLR